MPSAREVYNTFKSFQDRQEEILRSVQTEQAAIKKEYEGIVDYLAEVLKQTFPTTEDLPLDLLNAAVKHSNPEFPEGRFEHLKSTLLRENQTTLEQLTALETKSGSLARVKSKISGKTDEIDQLDMEIRNAERQKGDIDVKIRIIEKRLRPITHAEYLTNSDLDDGALASHKGFKLWSWMTDSDWRAVHNAAVSFSESGTSSLADTRTDLAEKTAAQNTKATAISSLTEARKAAADERTRLEDVSQKLSKYKNDLKTPDQIHHTLCAAIADYLTEEDVTRYLGNALPKEQAEPLMVATLKFVNLSKMYNNLEELRVKAEDALGKVSEPVTKLQRHRTSSRTISNIDLDEIGSNLETFNGAVTSAVSASAKRRQAINTFSPTSSSYYSRSSDDAYSNMNTMMLYWILMSDSGNTAHAAPHFNDATTPCHPSGHDPQGIPAPSGDISIPNLTDGLSSITPDLSGAFSNLSGLSDMPTITLPDITVAVPDISVSIASVSDGGLSGGWSGGGDIGGSMGGGCDGGMCISISMNDDPMFRKHARNMELC